MTPQKKRHYSIRKLRAGVGSILIGTTLLFGLSTQLVQANTPADGTTTSDSAEGTTAVPSVTNTTPATTATGGGTATTEENPKAEEPTEKPVEETPKETAPKVEEKAETPNATTNPADHPMVKELEKLLKEVEELPVLESTDYFKEQINIWNEQGKIAKGRLDIAKKGENKEKVEGFLGEYVQFAKIEKMARHAQQLYKKHGPNTEMLDLIKKAFGIGKDQDTYASLEGSTLEGYVRDTVTTNYNKILELAKELEEKAKKEKEKEKPAPAPAPEEPKKEAPAPTPEEPKKEEKPAPAPTPEEPKKEEEKPTPAPTPEEPKKEEEKPTPAPTPEPKKEEKPAPAPAPEPKKDTEKPAPSQPKQDDSMKKDYKLFYQTKDKTEEVDFKGTPEELKATLDKAIEKYKQDG
ncbi:GAG-binding domain-containing protein, partial [Streptococcus ruminantium]|uniref:GAG-binding domain-containing protein n=1 Tax=Streptococcus ruminantium TaxID=1917441 RepID=UPI0013EF4D1D